MLTFLEGLLFLSLIPAAHPDAPLPPFESLEHCNSSNTYCAVSDPVASTTLIRAAGSDQTIWSVPHYFRFITLAPDGAALIALSSSGNLVPLDATNETILFSIYREGKLISVIRMGDLFENPSLLPRTASHRTWGEIVRLTTNTVAFRLPSGGVVNYSLRTGLRQQEE